MLLYKTIRCSLEGNEILPLIDSIIGTIAHTRMEAAEAIFAAAMEDKITLFFEEDMIRVQLPSQYVKLCTNQGQSFEQIIMDCITRGLRWL